MKTLLLSMIRGWLIEEVHKQVINPLRKKARDSQSRWDDELVDEIEKKILNWLN